MVLSISSGYSPDYLLKEVATGRENYYTGAVSAGEPPGRWWGSGAELRRSTAPGAGWGRPEGGPAQMITMPRCGLFDLGFWVPAFGSWLWQVE